ncbi:hypothetical protein BC938DRAFT_477020 [Jimgerdemannia flammicorona]|uniref:dolichyl-phosphate beta-D-mannosyltransferase n=1 Tax=Jimgerdemannia flammicorona TaxID=994334 RepID=A0A433PCL5_9FUNG|nr:hypothetical protein BC938DRAFT_477020 [Jimgerdemannia flammicorona]
MVSHAILDITDDNTPTPLPTLTSPHVPNHTPHPHTDFATMASTEDKYSVLLPTYNERENLPIIVYLLVKTFKQHDINWEIVIIDDNSPDGTQEIAGQLAKVYGEDRIARPISTASSSPLATLSSSWMPISPITVVILLCQDPPHIAHISSHWFTVQPKFIPQFIRLQKQHNYDLVSGTRYRSGGGVYGWDLKRKVIRCGPHPVVQSTLKGG